MSNEIEIVERVYWTVCSSYGIGDEYPSFEAAVEAARAGIQEFNYGLDTVNYSRAFVALRQKSNYPADRESPASGIDHELRRWEAFLDRTVLIPEGQGGLTDEQRARTTKETA